MNKLKKEKEEFYKKILDLDVYLGTPVFFKLKSENSKKCFCVEAHHLFNEIKKDLDKLEEDLLERYGYDRESIEYVDYD